MITPVCRVCLASDVGMHSIEHMPLLAIYETLTRTKFHAEDGMPNTICYICNWQLQRCHRFSETACRSQTILNDLLHTSVQEVTSDTLKQNLRYKQLLMSTSPVLSLAPTQFWYLIDDTNKRSTTISVKQEDIKEETISEDNVWTAIEDNIQDVDNEVSGSLNNTAQSNDHTNKISSTLSVKQEVMKEETITEDNVWIAIENNIQNVDIEVSGRLNNMAQSMKGSSETDNKAKHFCCDVCNKSFTTRRFLVAHLRIHSVKPYACNKCNKTFIQQHNLTKHMRVHTREKPYACNRCCKTFADKGYLTKHIRIHTGEKPYTCSRCNQTFIQKCHMTKHMKIHTGEKPHACNRCSKAFSEKGLLTRHMQVHTGVKPYTCTECGKTFSEKGNLTRHMQVHTGVKPYACSRCSKTFSEKGNLTKHMRKAMCHCRFD